MKLIKKITAAVLMLAVAISCFSVAPMDVQAADKTTTYVLDSKKGVYYPTKVRAGIQERYNSTDIYLVNEGDYVASVKSNSANLIAKITKKVTYTGDHDRTIYIDDNTKVTCKSYYGITYYAKKKGTYTLTVTVKNAKKKTVCKKKIKVYAEEFSAPIKSFKYAGTSYLSSQILTKKKSGKVQVAVNKGFKLKKIEVGTYVDGEYEEYDPELVYKPIKNRSKISLATSTKYTSNVYKYESGSYYSYKSGTVHEYLYPITVVRVTYKDLKLGTVETVEYNIFYQNK